MAHLDLLSRYQREEGPTDIYCPSKILLQMSRTHVFGINSLTLNRQGHADLCDTFIYCEWAF